MENCMKEREEMEKEKEREGKFILMDLSTKVFGSMTSDMETVNW